MLAADPCVVGPGPARGFLTRDPPPGSTAPEPTISRSLSPSRGCAATPYTNHCPAVLRKPGLAHSEALGVWVAVGGSGGAPAGWGRAALNQVCLLQLSN